LINEITKLNKEKDKLKRQLKGMKKTMKSISDICSDYIFTDGDHHKQYALVETVKLIYGKNFKKWLIEQEEYIDPETGLDEGVG
jgi:hypothetical protein